FGVRGCAEVNLRARPVAQLQMARKEVGVEVRQKDVLDVEPVLAGEREVLVDVALRIDDGCDLRLLVGDEVRRVRKAVQIELLEDHTGIIMRPPQSRAGWRNTPAENFSASAQHSPACMEPAGCRGWQRKGVPRKSAPTPTSLSSTRRCIRATLRSRGLKRSRSRTD